jgi:hypothetical protein
MRDYRHNHLYLMNTTTGVFTTHADAERAIKELQAFGVDNTDISYVYMNVNGDIVDANTDSKVGGGIATGVTTGGVIGALAGLAVANGILPGLGTLFVAGPLAAVLGFTGVAAATISGAATGAAAGGLIGALSGLGISDTDAMFYETLVRSGEVLVVANTKVLSTKDVFLRAGAREVREYIR